MTVKARMRRELDKVHGATTTARLVLETTRASLRYLNVLVDAIAIAIGIRYGQSGARGIVRTRALSFALYLAALVFGVVILPLVLLGPTIVDSWLPERMRFAGSLYWPAVVVATVAALTTLFHVATPQQGALVACDAGCGAGAGHLGVGLVRGPRGRRSVAGRHVHQRVAVGADRRAHLAVCGGDRRARRRRSERRDAGAVAGLGPSLADRGLVEWARTEMDRRRSYGEGEGDPLLDDLMASEQQYLDLAWPSEPRQVEHRRAP